MPYIAECLTLEHALWIGKTPRREHPWVPRHDVEAREQAKIALNELDRGVTIFDLLITCLEAKHYIWIRPGLAIITRSREDHCRRIR